VNYVYESNDLTWTRQTWPQWQAHAAWIMSQINSTTGLPSLEGLLFLGGENCDSGINYALLKALNRIAVVATAIGDTKPQRHHFQLRSTSTYGMQSSEHTPCPSTIQMTST
jgi:hypothetical protein